MTSILLLTKCVFNEKEFEEKLLRLNYEVFSSSNFMPKLHATSSLNIDYSIARYFDAIIFSETLTDVEVSFSISILSKYSSVLFRKTRNPASVKLRNCLAINSNSSIEDLREILSADKNEENQEFDKDQLTKQLKLSKLETRLLVYLIKHKDIIVPREELGLFLWGDKPTKSNLSSLSNMVKKIKIKLNKYYGSDENLQTFWGKGYSWRSDF